MSTDSSSLKSELLATALSPQVISAVVGLILEGIEAISSSQSVDRVITVIQGYLPAIASLAPDLVTDIQNIVAGLMNKNITDAQMAALVAAKTALDTQTDADIAAALAYAGS